MKTTSTKTVTLDQVRAARLAGKFQGQAPAPKMTWREKFVRYEDKVNREMQDAAQLRAMLLEQRVAEGYNW